MSRAARSQKANHATQVALICLDDKLTEFLRVCFSQIGVNTVSIEVKADLAKRKVEGYVVDLRWVDAEQTLNALRQSPISRRTVIFGIYSEDCDLRRFSKYGVNGLISWSAKRTEAIKILRSAQTLLLNELRRYARVPLASQVELILRGQKLQGITREISGGGMSVSFTTPIKVARNEMVDVAFEIPPGTAVRIKGVISWLDDRDELIGIKFSPDAVGQQIIRIWIDDYLGIS